MTSVGIRRLHGAPLPSRAHPDDVGYDLAFWPAQGAILRKRMTDNNDDLAWKVEYWTGPLTIQPGERYLLPTGIVLDIPSSHFVRISPRSSTLAKRGLLTAEGTIDPGYRGELYLSVVNVSRTPVRIEPGERLGQMVLLPRLDVQWSEQPLSDSSRGQGGFGSTGA